MFQNRGFKKSDLKYIVILIRKSIADSLFLQDDWSAKYKGHINAGKSWVFVNNP